MAIDALAIVAAALIGCSEVLACNNLWLASKLMVVALALLLLAFRVAYFVIFALLAATIGCGLFLDRLPAKYQESSQLGALLGKQGPRWVAGLVHLWGLHLLPVCIMWGLLDVYKEELFYSEEMGHQLASTSYMATLVITPLLLMTPGYEQGNVEHQKYESIVMVLSSAVYFMSFRIAHVVEGRNPPHLTAPDWDHELIGLFWLFGGALGLVNASAGSKTSAHIVFPAAYVFSMFVNHTDLYPDTFTGKWLHTWMIPHKVHAICFGVGAACRLLHRIPESVYFFYLGIAAWCFSTKDVALAMYNLLTYDHDVESGWSPECDPNCDVNYPTHHVVKQIVILLGAAGFPIHFLLLGRLRKFVDQWSGVAEFMALSTSEADDLLSSENETDLLEADQMTA